MAIKKLVDGQWVNWSEPLKTDIYENHIQGVPYPSNPVVAGDTPLVFNPDQAEVTATSSLTASGIKITIPRSGIYNLSYVAFNAKTGDAYARLYKNGTAIGTQRTINNNMLIFKESNVNLSRGDIVEIYGRAYKPFLSSTDMAVGALGACINWDNTF